MLTILSQQGGRGPPWGAHNRSWAPSWRALPRASVTTVSVRFGEAVVVAPRSADHRHGQWPRRDATVRTRQSPCRFCAA